MQIAAGMCISQLLQDFMLGGPPVADLSSQADKLLHNERLEVFEYFGTFSRTLVSMFEITTANWAPSCRLLVKNVNEWYSLFFVIYRCCVCFAVIRVIGAVFITETMRVVAANDDVAAMRKKKEKTMQMKKLQAMFFELDESGDGSLNHDEFLNLIHDPKMKVTASALEIDTSELEELFHILADEDGEIGIDDFIKSLMGIQGVATRLAQFKLLKYSSHRFETLSSTLANMTDKLDALLAAPVRNGMQSKSILDSGLDLHSGRFSSWTDLHCVI